MRGTRIQITAMRAADVEDSGRAAGSRSPPGFASDTVRLLCRAHPRPGHWTGWALRGTESPELAPGRRDSDRARAEPTAPRGAPARSGVGGGAARESAPGPWDRAQARPASATRSVRGTSRNVVADERSRGPDRRPRRPPRARAERAAGSRGSGSPPGPAKRRARRPAPASARERPRRRPLPRAAPR